MRTLFGVALNSLNTIDGPMEEKWLCTLCFLEWKHKYHTLSPRDADLTVVGLNEMMLGSLADDESRDLYLEWVAEHEAPLVVHGITEATDEGIEDILKRAFGEEG
jgi:hypothetical protein